MNQEKLLAIASQFALEGEIETIKPLGEGFINDTFTVVTVGDAPNYILQRKNHIVFPDVPGMMDNILAVTNHIKAKVADPMRETLTVVPAKDGKLYVQDGENYWAVCVFIADTASYDRADSVELAYQGGVGIGRFQALLADFDKPLNETIKGFHNIRWRFQQWDETIAKDPVGRVAEVQEEIGWVEARRKEMLDFWSLVEDGTIPTHVTHNDTKISNILFDKPTGKVLCAIDLDTVMSSTSLNDFGDAIRSYTNTGAEDDKNLDNVEMSIDMFRAYAEGYLSEQRASMTQSELDWLAFAGRYITFEQVLRFLMDYIDGDNYYKTAYADHNLVRTHAQYKLLQSMERQYDEMCAIVKSLS
ncbi:MAG: aminoglycoside phosphotransferase family protein [Alistipes sp.]|nr:aminoglycoside phosphotransferase family protein [Rikenellaceae bacterium]MBQ3148147.1 aminoglycoside phosphotransferase family protein [Alistipes sp.]MBQ4127460.1 aminoglycoside phosphotransferase family protein [Alistipes sp.]